jgi:hypothetical protein
MTGSRQDWHIAQSNLRLAPYLALIAAAAAPILAFWVPFFPMFLSVAAALAGLTFTIQWFGVRRRASLGFIGTLLTIAAYAESRRFLLPKGITNTEHALAGAQFLAVWTLLFAVLHIVFRARLRRDLDDRAD